MTFEQALEAWARKKDERLKDREVTSISVKHNESWQDDQTYWEADTIVTVKTRKRNKPNTQWVYKTFDVYALGGDPMEFARELFEVAGEEES
jgi:hypothetical protein